MVSGETNRSRRPTEGNLRPGRAVRGTVRVVPARFPAPPLGASRFLRAWEDHRSGCACRVTVDGEHTVVVSLLMGWQEWRQFAFDDIRQSLDRIREQTSLSTTDLPGIVYELATGIPAMRSVLTEHLIEHGAAAFLPVLTLEPAQRVVVARAVLASLAARDTTNFDPPTWWVASEIVPLLDPSDLYRDVPVGLVLHPRAMPLTPCALGPVFALLRTAVLPGSARFETFTGLMGEWEGSFEDLLHAAEQL